MTTSDSEIRAIDDALAEAIWGLQMLADAQFGAAGEAAYAAQDTDDERDVRNAEAWRGASDGTYQAITKFVRLQRRLQGVPALVDDEIQAVANEAVRAWHAGEFDV